MMDFTCVSHIAEPEFCPSASLFSQTLSNHAQWTGSFNISEGEAQRYDRDARPTSSGSTFRDGRRPPGRSRVRHERPFDSGLWAEEESRRIRFAFANDTDSVSLAAQEDPPSGAMPTSAVDVDQSTMHNDSISMARNAHRDASQVTRSGLHFSDSAVYESLSVDDVRRTYDFVEFLLRWKVQCRLGELPPPSAPWSPVLVDSWRARKELSRRTRHSHTDDIQAIQWHKIGPSRSQALATRAALNPTGTKSCSQPTLAYDTDEEQHYRFRSFAPQARPAHISHYQLRNLLAANERSDIFYASGEKVLRTSLTCSPRESVVMDFSHHRPTTASFQITSLALSPSSLQDPLLVAGGFEGQYAILNLSSQSSTPPSEGIVTSSYNGLVTHAHIFPARISGLPAAAFCSNDHKLRLLDITTQTFTRTSTYAHAINAAAISPDGRLRALVGDSPTVLLTSADNGDIIHTLVSHTADGFACAWSPDGRYLATGAEDAQTKVLDARSLSVPVQSFPSVMSCPRSVRWTDSNQLIVAEGEDVVCIHDSDNSRGTWGRQQIQFFGCVAGVAVLDGGEEIVIANGDRNVGGLLSFQSTKSWNGGPESEDLLP